MRVWRLLCLLLASAAVSTAAVGYAQDTPPPQEPEAPEEPEAITMANFAIQANAVEDRLSIIETSLSATHVGDAVTRALAEIGKRGDALQEQFSSLRTRRMMNVEISSLETELELLQTRTSRQIEKLTSRSKELDSLSEANEADIEVWTRAVRDTRDANIPPEVRKRANTILRRLREAREGLEEKQGELLALQSQALDVLDAIEVAQRTVDAAQTEQAQSVFERQYPPIWAGTPSDSESEANARARERAGYDFGFSWPAVTSYIREVRAALIAQLLLVVLLGLVFTRTRALLIGRREKRQQGGRIPWEEQAIEAMRRPWAASLLVGLAAMRVLYPERVVDMVIVSWIIALPVWFLVYREMVPDAFHKPLLWLGLLGTLHIVVTLASGHAIFERLLLLVELLLATAGAAWMIRYLRTVEVPKRIRQGLWFSLASLWMRLAALMAGVGVVATVLGYTYFGEEAALVVTIGTISATAWMALARIAESLITTAIHLGKLDGLRMFRTNRDTTSLWLSRIIRIAAALLFVTGLANATSSWRPLADAIAGWLRTDMGLGFAETGVTFLDLLGFFFILWLSWLLSRFVAFVLQEEVLLRLHMQPGVPYAIKTFTRYVIIAVGFIAAMAVLGISLDRVTIILSALGVGVGFGLQGLVNNFVSGFVLLTERPIRLRDKVEIEGVLGHVSSIGIRASTIRTFDGAEVIVPNGDLISQRVVNWTLSARQQRVTIPVGVAYGTDPNQVLGILKKVAAGEKGVFKDPEPLALFRGFGDSSLDFELRIFMDPADVLDVPSAVTVAIDAALKEAGIEIPFPQRDLHLRGVPEGFVLGERDAGTAAGAGAGADAEPHGDGNDDR